MDAVLDRLIREAAFSRLDELTREHGELLPYDVLRQGFAFGGEQVHFLGPQGIFKPARMDVPLSVTTAPEKPGRDRPYEDEMSPDGFVLYRYRGKDPASAPQHPDNVGLRRCWAEGLPLVYFHGVGVGQYKAFWPAFIHHDDPATLTFTLALEDPAQLRPDLAGAPLDEATRAYTTRLAMARLHQARFRVRVLGAYRESCSVCRLRHRELLDAAHILPDRHPHGAPVVPNGIALCKIHHSAFDANILGIRPDHVVEIREDILSEHDGPMLQYGLQAHHGRELLVLPRRPEDRPKGEYLEERYEAFRAAG